MKPVNFKKTRRGIRYNAQQLTEAGCELVIRNKRCLLIRGDSRRVKLPPNSVDAIICDPPAAIGFMGHKWDGNRGGFRQWTKWLAGVLKPAFRALKPGGWILVWALPRTSHWTAVGVERAGFMIRDVIMHIFGSGFPKSLNISKAIDRHLGKKRKVVGKNPNHRAVSGVAYEGVYSGGNTGAAEITVAGSPEAAKWEGYGTALKPAAEHWIMAMKPFNGTYAAHVLEHGTGVLNINDSRIGTVDELMRKLGKTTTSASGWKSSKRSAVAGKNGGRWPAHVTLEHAAACVGTGVFLMNARAKTLPPALAAKLPKDVREVYACVPGCPVRVMDSQVAPSKSRKGKPRKGMAGGGLKGGWGMTATGAEYNDSGGPSRFFYVCKPPRKEKDLGLDHLPIKTGGQATKRKDGSAGLKNPRAGAGRGGGARNIHPTTKGVTLMRYFCRLICPPGGVIYDPFAGSGTTGVAAIEEGFRFIGTERSKKYIPITEGRLRHALKERRKKIKETKETTNGKPRRTRHGRSEARTRSQAAKS